MSFCIFLCLFVFLCLFCLFVFLCYHPAKPASSSSVLQPDRVRSSVIVRPAPQLAPHHPVIILAIIFCPVFTLSVSKYRFVLKKVYLHWLHLLRFSPLCGMSASPSCQATSLIILSMIFPLQCVFKCLLRLLTLEYELLHWLHLFKLSPLHVLICFDCALPLRLPVKPHRPHKYCHRCEGSELS